MPDQLTTDNVVIDTDPDADLSTADFGNVLADPAPPAPTDKAPPAAAPQRDANGRFVAKDTDPPLAGHDDDRDPTDPPPEPAAAADPNPDPDADPNADPNADPEAGGKAKMVPLSRFQEVVNQRNELATKLSETQAQHSAAQTQATDELKDILEARDKMYEEVETLRADGDVKGAAALQRKIDDANQRVADIKAGMVARQAAFMANENASYDRMLDQLENAYPEMNPNAPEFDQTVVREMEFQVQAYEKMGIPPTQALRRAAVLIFREDPFSGAPKKAATPATPAPAAAPAARKTNVAKNVDAAKRTPPEAPHKTELGDGKGTKNVFDMTDEEMAALPASVLARMRGDMLE